MENINKLIFWYRLGDNANYESTSLEAFLNLLQDLEIKKVRRTWKYGLTDDDKFKGYNYISAFYGDEEAQPVRALTDREIKWLNSWLNGKDGFEL